MVEDERAIDRDLVDAAPHTQHDHVPGDIDRLVGQKGVRCAATDGPGEGVRANWCRASVTAWPAWHIAYTPSRNSTPTTTIPLVARVSRQRAQIESAALKMTMPWRWGRAWWQ